MKKTILIGLFLINTNNVLANDNIAIFKNGSGFFTKELKLEVKENIAMITDIPDALFGTIYFSSDNTIKSIKSEQQVLSYKVKAGNLLEIINANINRKAKITFQSAESFETKIEKTEGELLFFRLKDNLATVNLNSIKMIEFIDNPNYEITKSETKKIIKIEFSNPVKSQNLKMMYMQKNIGWIPSYFIDLQNENTAKILLTANVINDAEDIINSDISLVVGVPSFSYSYLKSPLTSNQNLNDFLKSLEYNNSDRGLHSNAMSNIINQSTRSFQSSNTEEYNTPDNLANEINISEQEDLYFYNIPKINLKKDSRAIFEILKANIKYEDIYEVDLETNQNKNYYAYEPTTNNILPSKVYHYITFNNNTGYPLTTGTAMVTKNFNNITKPISQNKLDYVANNSKAKLKLTVSSDIYVTQTEKENSRIENLKFEDGNYYDQQKIETKIKIKNSKNKAVKLNIKRIIEGKLENSNYKWSTTILNVYKAQNKTNQVEWNLELKPQESKEIIYNYSSFLKK